MRALAEAGILTGVSLMPVLPFIGDNEDNIRAIVEQAQANGARYIIPWFSVTLRDRQRDYFYAQLDRQFPGLRQRYQRAYGERYEAVVPNAGRLAAFCHALCAQNRLSERIPTFTPVPVTRQLKLFEL